MATLLAPDDRGAAGIDLASDPRRVRQVIGLAGQSASIEPAMTGKEPEVGCPALRVDDRAAHSAASEVIEPSASSKPVTGRFGLLGRDTPPP